MKTNHDKKRLERFGEVWIAIETYGLVFWPLLKLYYLFHDVSINMFLRVSL